MDEHARQILARARQALADTSSTADAGEWAERAYDARMNADVVLQRQAPPMKHVVHVNEPAVKLSPPSVFVADDEVSGFPESPLDEPPTGRAVAEALALLSDRQRASQRAMAQRNKAALGDVRAKLQGEITETHARHAGEIAALKEKIEHLTTALGHLCTEVETVRGVVDGKVERLRGQA